MATRPDTTVEDGSRFLISDLCKMLESYMDEEQVQDVYRAYLFGAEAHEGQHRMSGVQSAGSWRQTPGCEWRQPDG